MKSIATPAEKCNLIEITVPRLPSAADFADAVTEQYRGEQVRGPVHVSLEFFFTPPKYLSKAQRAKRLSERMGSRSACRLGSACSLITRPLRACEGRIWPNDEQVVSAMGQMVWGEVAKTIIKVVELDVVHLNSSVLPEAF